MLQQQALVDQLIDEDRKAQADKALGTQQWASQKFDAIESEIGKRNAKKKEEEQQSMIQFNPTSYINNQ